jgi:hypothetical protein
VAQQFRTCGPGCCRALLVTSTLLLLSSSTQSAVARDADTRRLVGMAGQLGSYEEVQDKLDQLEWQKVKPTAEKANCTLKELYDGQMAWRNDLQSIEVDFDYSLQRFRDTARVIAQKRQKVAVPDNFSFQASIAMKGEKRFSHTRYTTPPTEPTNSGNAISTQQVRRPAEFVYAYNGAEMRSFEPSRSVGHIHRAKVDAVDSHHLWYFDAISVPTGRNASKQSKSAWFVPIALSLPSVYRLLPMLQEVDGFRCHVVTNGADTIWIDADHGCAMRRRVWFQVTGSGQMPVLMFVYVNQDFRQYADRIWLPNKCYRLDFAGALESSNTQGLLSEVHTITAKTINVNDVSDDVFEFAFPAGSNVFDLVTNKSYVVPHGENLLDEAIARANPIVNGEVQPFRSAAGLQSVWRQVLILNAAVLVLVGGRVLWRRRRGSTIGL